MKGLDAGRDKVKKICDILKKETLEPAKKEAQDILVQAEAKAKEIVEETEKKCLQIQEEFRREMERQREIFHASLKQASRQAVELLKQGIEEKFFHPELMQLLTKPLQEPKVVAQLVETVVRAIEKEGIETNLSVYIPAHVSAGAINTLLGQKILEKLKEKTVMLGVFGGGIQVKLHDAHITLDISVDALKELLAGWVRKDFREFFFGSL